MDASVVLFETLYWISYALLYPVIILLLAFVIWSLASAGEFISEYGRRYRNVSELEQLCKKIDISTLRNSNQPFFVSSFLHDLADHISKKYFNFDRLFGDYEIKMAKKLEKTRILATVGPMLGLMGTLIPLGPALMGLAQGNVEQLAHNLVIAFATTVLGLFSGAIGFVITMIRRRWYQQDINDIECILDTFESNYGKE
ncbi:MAG: MotA/TolQ/ExbB proton channel family protein [Euryarchaeota archaeon]|nr:MotA/TolQ/ExbB proton channel family protein [Euryarchaeota archaeon]